jgi:DNA-binding CsgD family transcriptional regulator
MKKIRKVVTTDEWAKLTKTEWDIILRMIEGDGNLEIAASFGVSRRTIEYHRQNILEKTECRNTVHLVATIFKQKLIDLEEKILTNKQVQV